MKRTRPHSQIQLYKNLLRRFTLYCQEEILAGISLLRLTWPLTVVILMGLGALVYFVRPFPPSSIRIAIGQPNSSLHALGQDYAEYFKKHGVSLQMVHTSGASENLQLLREHKVDVAFSLSGTDHPRPTDTIETLGSVEHQPFWLFYRGKENHAQNPTQFFDSLRLSINLPGSGTYHLSEKILQLHHIPTQDNPHLHTLNSKDSVEALQAGRLDGMFLTAGIESSAIQALMAIPDIHIFHFATAEAYTNHLRYLQTITLPYGALDVSRPLPAHPVQMVAATTTILVDQRVHPAIQQLFILTAKKLHASSDKFLSRQGGFPANTEHDWPLSPVADRFYSKGAPLLDGYVPYWVASLFDQVWFLIFALFAFLYPLIKSIPNHRAMYTQLQIANYSEEIERIDSKIQHTPLQTTTELLELLKSIEDRILDTWIPHSHKPEFIKILESVQRIRSTITPSVQIRDLDTGKPSPTEDNE